MTGRSRTLARAARDDAGVALVEFALVIPVLLVVLIGALDFGRAVNAYVTVNAAAREGARQAALNPGLSEAQIRATVRERIVPLDASRVDVSASYYGPGSTLRAWPPTATASSQPPARLLVRVDVSHDWSAVTWLAGRFFAGGTGSRTFSASSTMEGRW